MSHTDTTHTIDDITDEDLINDFLAELATKPPASTDEHLAAARRLMQFAAAALYLDEHEAANSLTQLAATHLRCADRT